MVPDEFGGAVAAVRELLDHGHRRIGFCTDVSDIPATRGRLAGYQQALADDGIEFDPSLAEGLAFIREEYAEMLPESVVNIDAPSRES